MIADSYEPYSAEIIAINEKLLIASVQQQELAEMALQSADAALQAEHRLRDLVSGLDAVICEIDTWTGCPSFLSLRAETFLGHPLDKWLAQPDFLTEIIHTSDRARATALFPAFVENGQDYEYEFRALSEDKDTVWMRNIVRLVRDDQGGVLLLRCVIVDVTTQRQVTQALEEAHTRERNIAQTLQRSMLFMPPENAFPGMAVKTIYEAASDEALVGGDFWDTFACDHGHVALVLGDVMRHGLPAAMFTAELKYVLRGFIREHEQPGRILAQMNSYLCEGKRLFGEGLNAEADDAPVCLAVVIVNTATGHGKAAVGGMEPPLLVRNDGQMEELEVHGLLLGFQEGEDYEETTFQLGAGDMMILTTDGVTEARQGSSFLGYEGLMRLAQEGRALGTLEMAGQTILDGSRAFAGGERKDDACVLLMRRQ